MWNEGTRLLGRRGWIPQLRISPVRNSGGGSIVPRYRCLATTNVSKTDRHRPTKRQWKSSMFKYPAFLEILFVTIILAPKLTLVPNWTRLNKRHQALPSLVHVRIISIMYFSISLFYLWHRHPGSHPVIWSEWVVSTIVIFPFMLGRCPAKTNVKMLTTFNSLEHPRMKRSPWFQQWQTVFEDTLSEYHRLSTTLASRHDLTEAISVRIPG